MNAPLNVRDYMTTDLITVTPDMEIMRAVYLLVDADISGAPVVDADGRLVGILTERDCIETAVQAGYFDEAGGSVADYMSAPVETVTIDESLMNVAERMIGSAHRRFPVLDNGRLVGLISRRDVLHALRLGSWFGKAT